MHEDVDDVIARRRVDPAGLNRALSASMAIHFGIVLALLVIPKDFWAREQSKLPIMTISLSGSGGERSGGMVSAGARPVEQVAPQPKRSEPIPPATPPKASSVTLSAKAPVKTKPVPTTTPSPATRTPTTGAQTRPGTAAAETGAVSQNTGLTFGGKAPGDTAVNLETTFCCPDYIMELQRRIVANWPRQTPETGSVTVMFEVLRDGTFTAPKIEVSGGVILDAASLKTFQLLHLQPLPKEYPGERLKIHLTFPYVR
jgi:hypothetical protein